ncbi:hypothetical protein MTR_4g060740 [Medicago truncatula]|uniref:Uncharacterized protein n=1 Tax=Medicago truncatula TaxID=3880 RepID=G7JQI0_MEDTR|nr:hypothetical protein MTR_4g060740 [Medicago truncatula]
MAHALWRKAPRDLRKELEQFKRKEILGSQGGVISSPIFSRVERERGEEKSKRVLERRALGIKWVT